MEFQTSNNTNRNAASVYCEKNGLRIDNEPYSQFLDTVLGRCLLGTIVFVDEMKTFKFSQSVK